MAKLKGKTMPVYGSATRQPSADAFNQEVTFLTGSVDAAIAAKVLNNNVRAKNREANKDRLAARRRP